MNTDEHGLPENWRTGWRSWLVGGGAGLLIALLMLPFLYLGVLYLFGPATAAWGATNAWWKWPAAIAVYLGAGFLLIRHNRRFRRIIRESRAPGRGSMSANR